MNKQEAIEEILKSNHTKLGLDFDDEVRVTTVIDVINQIDEPEKPVIPQFVAEWIEEIKGYSNLYDAMKEISYGTADSEILEWFCADKELTSEILARAWLDGYEVEKEKLYTVEIPDPHGLCNYRYLRKNSNGVTIGTSDNDLWKTRNECQLTEEEIKEDFSWAWKWAKPVEVE